MFHRIVWEDTHGVIPDDYEINHKCHNRACQNLDHLECIPGSRHAAISNTERSAEATTNIKEHWLATKCTGTNLAQLFDISISQACRYIRQWKQ